MSSVSGAGAAGGGRDETATKPAAPPMQREASDEYTGTDALPDEQKLLKGVDVVEGDDEAGFTVLERQTCFNLMKTRDIGRVAFTIGGDPAPTVLPVNYALVDEGIVFRSALAGTIMHHARGYASFQVDLLDEERREGWTVLASGRCEWIRDPDELARIPQGRLPKPWAAGHRDQVLRINPGRLTGRQIRRP